MFRILFFALVTLSPLLAHAAVHSREAVTSVLQDVLAQKLHSPEVKVTLEPKFKELKGKGKAAENLAVLDVIADSGVHEFTALLKAGDVEEPVSGTYTLNGEKPKGKVRSTLTADLTDTDFLLKTPVYQEPKAEPEKPATMTASNAAKETIDVPVPARNILPGEKITEDDLTWVAIDARAMNTRVIGEMDQLVGMEARRPLRANRMVLIRDVRTPRLIQKGEIVTVRLQTPVMALAMQGRALSDGGVDEVVRILNPISKKIVDGTVVAPGVVEVAMPMTAATVTKTATRQVAQNRVSNNASDH